LGYKVTTFFRNSKHFHIIFLETAKKETFIWQWYFSFIVYYSNFLWQTKRKL